MRKLLHYLFPFCLLVICVMRPTRAEAPEVCKGCEVTKEQIEAFVLRAQRAVDEANERAWRAEHKAISCETFLKDHHA